MAEPATATDVDYDERLHVPWSWWPVVLLIVALGTLEIASGFSYVVFVPVVVFLVGFFVVPLLISGRVRVQVTDGRLRAGSRSLPLVDIRSVRPLDRQQARLRLGPQADPAAYVVMRGWIGTAVLIQLRHTASEPYWLVSTRRPDALAAALRRSGEQAR